MPDGVASIRRLSAAASIIRYLIVMLVWPDRYLPHRRVARDRLFPRGTLVLQPGIDSSLGPNVTLPRSAYARAASIFLHKKSLRRGGFSATLTTGPPM